MVDGYHEDEHGSTNLDAEYPPTRTPLHARPRPASAIWNHETPEGSNNGDSIHPRRSTRWHRRKSTGLGVLCVLALGWSGSLWWEESFLQRSMLGQSTKHPRLDDFANYLVHTPKTGGSYAFDALLDLLEESPAWVSTPPSDRRVVCDGRTDPPRDLERSYPARSQPLAGMGGRTPLSSFPTSWWRRWLGSKASYACNLWMAEHPYFPSATANYVILRSPRAHILSQYFHCKESVNHYDRWMYMPKRPGDWLQAWVDASRPNATGGIPTVSNDQDNEFRCYDPRSMQTRYAGFDAGAMLLRDAGGDGTSGGFVPMGDDDDVVVEGGVTLENDLARRFAVVGDNSEMVTSVCLIFLHYTQGAWIPPVCVVDPENEDDTTHRRRLKIHFHGHGVRHHGSTYPTTPTEDALLEELGRYDQILYEAGKAVFEQQIQAAEDRYNITMVRGRHHRRLGDATQTANPNDLI